jgi:FixJ family two-component response regulator
MTFIISGILNKQIAAALNITEKTVKAHRGKVMTKMGVSSVAELVRIAEKLGIKPAAVSN